MVGKAIPLFKLNEMSNCGCKNKINSYVDLSEVEITPWDDITYLLGLTTCYDLRVVDKPEFDFITPEDREKLNHIIIDGEGDLYLANDGEYKTISVVNSIVLDWSSNAINFVLNNQEKLHEIVSNIQDDKDTFIRLQYNDLNTVIFASIESDILTLEYDKPYVTVQNEVAIARGRMKFTVQLNISTEPYNVVFYNVVNTPDADFEITDIKSDVGTLQQLVSNNTATISGINTRLTTAEGTIQTHTNQITQLQNVSSQNTVDISNLSNTVNNNYTEFNSFKDTVNGALITLNGEIDSVSDRVTENTENIVTNRTDIDGLINTVGNIGHFRGYQATTDDVTAITNPRQDDYAYNVETGTIWIYNGTTWANSGEPIPDGAIPASDSIPLVDAGNGEAGTSSEYARGDHRHPEDTNKANASDLANYVLLAGNSQTTPITGDLWLSTQRQVRLTDSGNTSIGIGQTGSALEITGAGAGGGNLLSPLGTWRYNGNEIATVDQLTPGNVITNNGNAIPIVLKTVDGTSTIIIEDNNITIEGHSIFDGNIDISPEYKILYTETDENGISAEYAIVQIGEYFNIIAPDGTVVARWLQVDVGNTHIPLNFSHSNNPITGKYIGYDVGAWILNESGYPAIAGKQLLSTFTEGTLHFAEKFFSPNSNMQLEGITPAELQVIYFKYEAGITNLFADAPEVYAFTINQFTVNETQVLLDYNWSVINQSTGGNVSYNATISGNLSIISGNVSLLSKLEFVTLTQAEYDSLPVKDSFTYYFTY